MISIIKDPRIIEVKRIINSIGISKSDLSFSDMMLTNDNKLVVIVRETVLYVVPLMNTDFISNNYYGFNKDCLEDNRLKEDEFLNDTNIVFKNYDMYLNYMSIIIGSVPIMVENNLRENDKFEECLSLKADDGARFFKLNGYELNQTFFIPVFSSFLSLNKPDTVGIEIYTLPIQGIYLNKMNIYKKKINRIINMFFRTLDLN